MRRSANERRLDLCENCWCTTWHINGRCGKCKKQSVGYKGFSKGVDEMLKKTATYTAFGLALIYLSGGTATGLTVRKGAVKLSRGKREDWYYFYKNRKRVFSCNPEFFKAWFRREK